MSGQKNSFREQDYYPWLCEMIQSQIGFQKDDIAIAYSYDKILPAMIADIEEQLGGETVFHNGYIPKLKLDILFGVKYPNQTSIKLVLFEIKNVEQLNLQNYSQLIGYLLVAQKIELGILLNVIKVSEVKNRPANNPLSGDFAEILLSQSLPMKFHITNENESLCSDHNTGVCYCMPNSIVKWVDTTSMKGISGWKQLVDHLTLDD